MTGALVMAEQQDWEAGDRTTCGLCKRVIVATEGGRIPGTRTHYVNWETTRGPFRDRDVCRFGLSASGPHQPRPFDVVQAEQARDRMAEHLERDHRALLTQVEFKRLPLTDLEAVHAEYHPEA